MGDKRRAPRSGRDYLFPAAADLLILALYIWKVFLQERRTPGVLIFSVIAVILAADLVWWHRFFKGNKKPDDTIGGDNHE